MMPPMPPIATAVPQMNDLFKIPKDMKGQDMRVKFDEVPLSLVCVVQTTHLIDTPYRILIRVC